MESGKPTGGVPPSPPPPHTPPPSLPPSSAVEEGGIGDLLLDNKPTFTEGHTHDITRRAQDKTELAALARSFLCSWSRMRGAQGSLLKLLCTDTVWPWGSEL